MSNTAAAAVCLFLAGGFVPLLWAQESPAYVHDSSPIPIVAAPDDSASTSGPFHFTLDPLIAQRTVNASGQLVDSRDEHFGVGYRLPLPALFTIGYDTGVNAFRQDQTIFDDDAITSQVTTAFINKLSLEEQAGPKLKLTEYVQGQRSFTGGQDGYSDSTKYGGEGAWMPVKDVTTVKLQAARQETVQINRSILDEKAAALALDQKLPYLPLTLHGAGSLTSDTVVLSPAQDKDSTVRNASVEWKLRPDIALSTGLQYQDSLLAASSQTGDTYFTQLSLQPAPAWSVMMKAAQERKAAASFAADQLLSTSSDTMLIFGVNLKLADRWSAGLGLNYRLLQSQQPPASPQSTPPASVSLSAGGSF